MSDLQKRSATFSDAAIDALFAGSGERLLAAYLRNALHTISPGVVAFWAELLAEALAAESAQFAQDLEGGRQYGALLEAMQVDALALRSHT